MITVFDTYNICSLLFAKYIRSVSIEIVIKNVNKKIELVNLICTWTLVYKYSTFEIKKGFGLGVWEYC